MSKEQIKKQAIEEMAKAMCGNGMPNGNCATDDEPCNLECVYGCCAEKLYAKDYRKQSEGEWKAYPDEHEICATEFVCSNCKESFCTNEMTDWEFIEMMNFCPNCGAKMKGGAE